MSLEAPLVAEDTGTTAKVRELRAVAEFERAVLVFCEVWDTDTHLDLVNASTLQALSMSGNYVAGLFVGDEMVGAAVAWRGDGHLHSHIVGVHPKYQGRGLGFVLKRHESQWALAHGFRKVQWTYDPLVRRNAHFNLSKLSAVVLGFYPNLYGALNDGLNDGDQTDRLLIEWTIPDGVKPAAVPEQCGALLVGKPPIDAANWNPAGDDGATIASADDSVRLILVPADVESMRVHEPHKVVQWRLAVRAGFEAAKRDGFEVTGFSSEGCYILRRP